MGNLQSLKRGPCVHFVVVSDAKMAGKRLREKTVLLAGRIAVFFKALTVRGALRVKGYNHTNVLHKRHSRAGRNHSNFYEPRISAKRVMTRLMLGGWGIHWRGEGKLRFEERDDKLDCKMCQDAAGKKKRGRGGSGCEETSS